MATEALSFGQRRALPEFLEDYLPSYLSGEGYLQEGSHYLIANVDGLVDLLAFTPNTILTNPQKVLVSSFYRYSIYDKAKGGGVFLWDSERLKTDHDGVTVISNTVLWNGSQATLSDFLAGTGETDSEGVGCWVRQYEVITVDMAGAVGNRIVNDTYAFQHISNILGDDGGGTAIFFDAHLIDSNLIVREYVNFQGSFTVPDQLRYQTPHDYDSKRSTLIINTAATITTYDGGSIGGCIAIAKGLSLPFADATAATNGIAAFAGTAFTVGGPGSHFHHMLVLGFDKAIYGTGYARTRCEYIIGDCTNGIDLQNVLDVSHLDKCHFWPFTTVHQAWTTPALTVRSGFGYRYKDTADWCKMHHCFSYGYDAGGTIIDSANNVEIWGGGSDFYNGLTPTQAGLRVIGNSRDARIETFQSSYSVGILINSTTSQNAATISANCFANSVASIRVTDGRAIIIRSDLRNSPIGIDIDPNCDGVIVDVNDFDTCTEPIKASGAGLRKSKIGINRYINCVDTQGIREFRNNGHQVTYNESYSAGVNGPSHKARTARGSVDNPTISQSGDIPWKHTSEVHDGTDFKAIGSCRFEAGTVAEGSTPGNAILSITPSGSTTPVDILKVNSSGFLNLLAGSIGYGAPVIKTSNFTIGATERTIINNKSGSTCAVTLPSASGYGGRILHFVNYQAQLLESASANVIPIDGSAATTSILPATAGKWADVQSDGANWRIIGQG